MDLHKEIAEELTRLTGIEVKHIHNGEFRWFDSFGSPCGAFITDDTINMLSGRCGFEIKLAEPTAIEKWAECIKMCSTTVRCLDCPLWVGRAL